jgi:hypothetical protein
VETPRTKALGDHRHQGALGATATLQQPVGIVGAGAQLGHRQRDRAGAAVEGALAVAVAAVGALRGTFAVGGAAEGVGLGAHQGLGEALDHLAQQVRLGL